MITRYTYKSLTWLDILNPTPEEIREIITETSLPTSFASDLTTMIPHSDCFSKKGALKLTLDWPVVRRTDINHPHEIKFLVTKTHLVTIHFEEIEIMQRFSKEFEVRCLLQDGSAKSKKETNPPLLFLALLNFLYDGLYLKLDYLESKLKEVEEEIFNEREREMVIEISNITRRLISFHQTLSAHENALVSLRENLKNAFGAKFGDFTDNLEHKYRSLQRQTKALKSTAEDLRNTNMALLSTKENEIMKLFTILAFITFPLTLFTSTFGMNTTNTPILGSPHDFWIIVGVMAIVSIAFFVFFKYKNWI